MVHDEESGEDFSRKREISRSNHHTYHTQRAAGVLQSETIVCD